MSYTPPAGDAANFSWVGQSPYTPPVGDAANFSWFESEAPPEEPLPTSVTVSAVFVGPVFSGVVSYDNRNPRRVSTTAAAGWQQAAPTPKDTESGWGNTARRLDGVDVAWAKAAVARLETDTAWGISGKVEHANRSGWDAGRPVQAQFDAVHQTATRLLQQCLSGWQVAVPVQITVGSDWQTGRPAMAQLVVDMADAIRLQALGVMPWQVAGKADRVHLVPWQVARPVPPGKEVWPPPGPGEPVAPRVPSTHLVFKCPPWMGGPVNLVFGRVCGPDEPEPPLANLYILPARYYMAVHSLTAHTLPDLTQFAIKDVSLSADAGSFGWSFGASGRLELFDLLAPSAGLPAQIRITLDGMQWAFIVDSLVEEERFGQRGVRIGGRSVTALVGAPYSREAARLNTSGMNAQQLAEAALEFTGVSLDWGIPDWLVPAGSWSHVGTPLAAVQAIVEASGGYLQSHRTLAQLQARHPYPDLPGGIPGGPWNWYGAFPADVELAPDSLVTRAIERKDGPDINAVYVSGTTAGPLAFYKRDGTAGEKRASPVTDPLITAEVVARMRGRSIVGAAGAKHMVRVDLPILTGPSQPGVLNVGQLVQVNTAQPWRARVRSVSASASFGSAPRQTVSLERHLETT